MNLWMEVLSILLVTSTTKLFIIILSQGKKYWRFDGDVLDDDYPREISLGFDNVPDDIDAAFSIPASSHRGREKAYFFKGNFVTMCVHFQYLRIKKIYYCFD